MQAPPLPVPVLEVVQLDQLGHVSDVCFDAARVRRLLPHSHALDLRVNSRHLTIISGHQPAQDVEPSIAFQGNWKSSYESTRRQSPAFRRDPHIFVTIKLREESSRMPSTRKKDESL